MAAPSQEETDELNSSKLGTKEYWDQTYENELLNFKNHQDVGEVWFGYDSMERVLDWLEESPLVDTGDSIIDLGCGNGVMLVELHKRGFTELIGMDYSAAAVQLASGIAEHDGLNIKYVVGDILKESPSSSCMCQKYDIVLDKGTYDAISLTPVDPKKSRNKYINNVQALVKPGGLFILTSCNWTKEEILSHFEEGFEMHEKIPTPTFMFGGKTGSRETSVILKKKC